MVVEEKRVTQHVTADGKAKLRYATRQEAFDAACHLKRDAFPYRCDVCGSWHLGRDRDAR